WSTTTLVAWSLRPVVGDPIIVLFSFRRYRFPNGNQRSVLHLRSDNSIIIVIRPVRFRQSAWSCTSKPALSPLFPIVELYPVARRHWTFDHVHHDNVGRLAAFIKVTKAMLFQFANDQFHIKPIHGSAPYEVFIHKERRSVVLLTLGHT